MTPVFLTLHEVVQVHKDQIERYGGMPGIRNAGLLQSAVAMPQASFGGQFLHHDLFEMWRLTCFISCRTTPLWTATNEQAQQWHLFF